MASRLTRWGVATVVAVVAASALLLPPGDSVLALWAGNVPAHPTNALDAAVEANRTALDAAQLQLRRLRIGAALRPFATGGPSPVVVRELPNTVVMEPELTALAGTIWRTVPRHPAAPRTILIVTGEIRRYDDYFPRDPGICIAMVSAAWRRPRQSLIHSGGGGCFLATEFGPPGRGLDLWLRRIGSVALPMTVHPQNDPVVDAAPSDPDWVAGYRDYYERRRWYAVSGLDACLGGRSAYCVEALGFGPGGTDSIPLWTGRIMQRELHAVLPATLLDELGPERFATIWRSDDPLPVAYEKVTGRPFDRWALDFARRRVGRLAADNGLSLAGWGGWAFWMVLFFVWLAVRLREQPAQ